MSSREKRRVDGLFNVAPRPNKKVNAWYKVGKSNNSQNRQVKKKDEE